MGCAYKNKALITLVGCDYDKSVLPSGLDLYFPVATALGMGLLKSAV